MQSIGNNAKNDTVFCRIELLRILDETNEPLSIQDIKQHMSTDYEFALEDVLATMIRENYVAMTFTSGTEMLLKITLAGRKKVNPGIMIRHL